MTATTSPDTATTRTSRGRDGNLPADVPQAEPVRPGACAVMGVVVRVAGTVPVRLDFSHAATREQQLGLSLGTVLVYLRAGVTARAVADGWANTAVLARGLAMGVVGKRPMPVGPSSVAEMVRLGGVPRVTAAWFDAVTGTSRPAMLRIQTGPVTWEGCDSAAYRSLLAGWRQAAQLLGDDDALDGIDSTQGEARPS
ncbi:hypothetical protein [Pseudonocardia dioxanivorans]|uniref:hypothetical protein n=1 Tax=Pseudonocardia dioxanivorans TaxID=240495 RepID=UPI000CD32242|nr:hypothetical protein [Pseudonocardia dioxanivorans]